MQRSFSQQIKDFNTEIHAFEEDRQADLEATIDIIQSLDLQGLERYANHLRANLTGITQAKSLEELDLYKDSFSDVLDSLTIDEDVLGIYPCIIHFRQVIDLSHASIEADLNSALQENLTFKNNTRLKWIDIGLNEFLKNAEELTIGLTERLNRLLKEGAAEEKLTKLDNALKKVQKIKEEMQAMRGLALDMLFAKSREEHDNKRKILAEQLRYMQRVGGVTQSGKDLQNHFIRIGRRHVDALYEARATYLPGPSGVARKAIDFGWIAAGAALTAVGAVLSAPVVVFALGIAGAAYGVIDLAKELTEPIAAHNRPELGKFEEMKPPLSTGEKVKRIGKKLFPIVLSALSLAAGITAFTFPPIGIAMAAIGLGLALFGSIMFAANWYQERKEIRRIAREHAAIQNQYIASKITPLKIKPSLEEKPEEKYEEQPDMQKLVQAKSSEAKIDLFLLGHKLDESISEEEMKRLQKKPHDNNHSLPESEKEKVSLDSSTSINTKKEEKKSDDDNEDEHFHLHR